MNVLIVGAGKGSFQIRAVQLGAAIGARVTSSPTDADWNGADRVVLLKKHAIPFALEARKRGLPIVWDALDFWQQPAENGADEKRALALFHEKCRLIRPATIIAATQAMADACDAAYLPHHTWHGLIPTPTREVVTVLGYQGNPNCFGIWHTFLSKACKSRGWRFVMDPPDLGQVDIVIALRDAHWNGWICREWKSGVKLGNAMAAGRPVITQESAAFRELKPVGCAIDGPDELDHALDRCACVDVRTAAIHQPLARSLTLEQISARYRFILQGVRMPCIV
jgi:hypothetical protein